MRKRVKRTFVTIIGSIVLLAGLVMVPYPGPGWLTVFAGLGILSTEYTWARNLLGYAKSRYDAWQNWITKQRPEIKAVFWVLTALVVIATIWILNGYGLINDLLNLGLDWVKSPLPIFK